MVRDAQVRLLRKKMAEGLTQEAAAAAAGMSERTARTWQRGPFPMDAKAERTWRTRKDPFDGVWESEVVPVLVADTDGVVEGTTMIAELRRRHGDVFGPSQLRTLQRRMQEWRALHGPNKEVYFEQRPVPGREGAFDFTDATELGITIAGQNLHTSVVRIRSHFQQVAVGEHCVLRDVRGHGRRIAGSSLGARRRAKGLAQ